MGTLKTSNAAEPLQQKSCTNNGRENNHNSDNDDHNNSENNNNNDKNYNKNDKEGARVRVWYIQCRYE